VCSRESSALRSMSMVKLEHFQLKLASLVDATLGCGIADERGQVMSKLWIGLGAAAIVGVVGFTSGFFPSFAKGFTKGFNEARRSASEGHPGLPSCDTETGLANARNAINNIPPLKKAGITALGISDAKSSLATETEVQCDGMVTLSNQMKGPVHYTFAKEPSVGGPFLVRAVISHLDKS
jgi:hypothetical protein